jgi:hypothetical protein
MSLPAVQKQLPEDLAVSRCADAAASHSARYSLCICIVAPGAVSPFAHVPATFAAPADRSRPPSCATVDEWRRGRFAAARDAANGFVWSAVVLKRRLSAAPELRQRLPLRPHACLGAFHVESHCQFTLQPSRSERSRSDQEPSSLFEDAPCHRHLLSLSPHGRSHSVLCQ